MAEVTIDIDGELLSTLMGRTGTDDPETAVTRAVQGFLGGPGKEGKLPTEEATSFWG